MTRLCVYLYDVRLGWLEQDKDPRFFDFKVDPFVFDHFRNASTVMSIAVPLVSRMNRKHVKRRMNFFSELLPEGRTLSFLAQNARLDETDTFGLLSRYGLDVAGALKIFPEADEHYIVNDEEAVADAYDKSPYYSVVDDAQVRNLLEDMARTPLGNAHITGKISLAGMQTKIVLARTKEEQWAQTHNGYPSTHIIKPKSEQHPSMIFDESWGLELARRIGLIEYSSELDEFDGLPALVIERYDRNADLPGGRIHQEDFNQVLGIRGSYKYQEIGGRVSLKLVAQKLADFTDSTEVHLFAEQLIFALAIGNLDLHAKNISVLHYFDETSKLSPAYDLVPMQHYENIDRMAMSVGGEYLHANLKMKHIADELLSWKHYDAASRDSIEEFIAERLAKILKHAEEVEIPEQAYPKLFENLQENCKRLIS